ETRAQSFSWRPESSSPITIGFRLLSFLVHLLAGMIQSVAGLLECVADAALRSLPALLRLLIGFVNRGLRVVLDRATDFVQALLDRWFLCMDGGGPQENRYPNAMMLAARLILSSL